ncbi:MAG: DUF6057 family protein [bacterium]|nr:DUF6057 family protein [bacterium]
MMRMKEKLGYGSLCWLTLLIYLQVAQADFFTYVEQFQLFLCTKQYAAETLCAVGGLSTYVARFVGQFFRLPVVGALVTASLLTALILLTQQLLERWTQRTYYLLPTLPVIGLLYVQLDPAYLPEGTWSYLFMLLALWHVTCYASPWVRLGLAVLWQTLLFWACGPVATLFAGMVLLTELLKDYKRGVCFLLLPLVAYGWGEFALYREWLGSERFLFSPDLYYDPLVKKTPMMYAWYALPMASLVAWAGSRWQKSCPAAWMQILGGWAVACSLAYMPLRDFGDRIDFTWDRLLRTGQWDELVAAYRPGDTNLQRLNVVNLALAKQGRLATDFLHYPQNNEGTLLAEWDHTVENALTLSEIYYQLGDIASAQKFAFEGNLSSQAGGNPRLLQLLVKTNLIFGAYPVARKYLYILQQTWGYRDWANEWMNYTNDEAVAKHPELGPKRLGLRGQGEMAVSGQLPKVLEQLMRNDPSNPMPVQYLTTYYLLNVNLKAFLALKEAHYGSPAWPKLTVPQQEAMVALLQQQPTEWVKHGVSLKVEHHFNEFDRDMNRYHNQMNVKEIMAEHYGTTYWYYLMFNRKKKAQ